MRHRTPESERRRAPRALAGILVLSAAAAAGGAPTPSQDDSVRTAYLAAVERWAAGDDGMAEAWADWGADELARLSERLPALLAGAPLQRRHEAARLHVLAAHAAAQHGRLPLWGLHFDLAEALLAAAVTPPLGVPQPQLDTDSLRRDVALAKGYALLIRWRPSFALDAFKRALEARPDDADALLGAGVAEELRVSVPALALDRYVSAPELVNRGAIDDLIPGRKVQRMDYENSLRAAEHFYRGALGADPGVAAEAHLRLGRILDTKGRRAQAEREWSAVLADAHGDLASLAHLFLGRAAERRREWGRAAEHYRAALAASPQAQSAHVALASVLDRLGDPAGAREQARAALDAGPSGARAVDPWLRYHFEPQRGLGVVLARLARRAP